MKKKILIVQADFGSKDFKNIPKQKEGDYEIEHRFYNDTNFPSRINSLQPRFKGKIPKMLEWYFYEADYYIWMDSYYEITTDYIIDLTKYVKDHDICLNKHNVRKSISEEVNFVLRGLDSNNYLKSRYIGEPLKEQLESYQKDSSFEDNNLFSMGFFIYTKNLVKNREYNLMTDWFLHNSIWTIQDQISFPYLLHKHKINYNVFDFDGIFKNPYANYKR